MSVDLEVLRRAPTPEEAEPKRRGAIVVGTVLVLGALGWAALLLKDVLVPPTAVKTAPVRVETGAASRRASQFDAIGWVEPDPFPTLVRPLVDGVVERLEVVEGAPVKANETVLARLRNPSIESEVEKAEKDLAHARLHLPEVDADVTEARRLLEGRYTLRADVARLEGEVKTAEAEHATAVSEIAVAESERTAAQTELSAQEALESGGSGVRVAKAKAAIAVATAEATVVAKKAAAARADAAAASARAQLEVARDALEHPVSLEAAVAKAQAHRKAAEADVASYETVLAIAKRYADLLVVRSPVDGVVLRRKAMPGSPVGPAMRKAVGAPEMGEGGDGDLVALYDPARLQVRANVPAASISAVGAGQSVEMTLDAAPGRTFHGEVLRLVSQADRTINSLEAKVRVTDPDPLMKPEMVVRVRFLVPAKEGAETAGAAAASVRILVPKAALRDVSGAAAVFVFDPQRGGRAKKIPVTKVADAGDDVEVTGALSATQRVILDDVRDDQRVSDAGAGGAS